MRTDSESTQLSGDQLLPAERVRRILEALTQNGSLRVVELARMFSVTEETVRRDLTRLERDGKIERSHGGASLLQSTEVESPYWMREVRHRPEKTRMAREAIKEIREGQRIFIDASSSSLHVARQLPAMDLTLITNSMQAASELSRHEHFHVTLIGGNISSRSLSCVGSVAAAMLEPYHADLLFLSCRGVDFNQGIYDVTEDQAAIRRLMIEQSDRRILLMDHTKFQVRSLVRVCALDVFDRIITDQLPDEDVMKTVNDLNLPVVLAGS